MWTDLQLVIKTGKLEYWPSSTSFFKSTSTENNLFLLVTFFLTSGNVTVTPSYISNFFTSKSFLTGPSAGSTDPKDLFSRDRKINVKVTIYVALMVLRLLVQVRCSRHRTIQDSELNWFEVKVSESAHWGIASSTVVSSLVLIYFTCAGWGYIVVYKWIFYYFSNYYSFDLVYKYNVNFCFYKNIRTFRKMYLYVFFKMYFFSSTLIMQIVKEHFLLL